MQTQNQADASVHSINDYGAEGINAKSDTLYGVVQGFLRDGVPVDAVGFQCHFALGGVPATLQQNLQRFADLGLDVAITELDINIAGPKDAAAFAQQARDYWAVVDACVRTTRCVSVVRAGPPRLARCVRLTAVLRCRPCGACRTITRGSRTATSSRGTPRSSPSRRSMRLRTRSRGGRSRR